MIYRDGSNRRTAAVVLCAGKGERTGLGYNKMLYPVMGEPVAVHSMKAFIKAGVDEVLCVISPSDDDTVGEYARELGAHICTGGETRTESVRAALSALDDNTDIVLIHDGARPFVTTDVILSAAETAAAFGSGIAAVRATDAIKEVKDGIITASPDKSSLYNAQTPQAFCFSEIRDAYDRISGNYGDDAEVYALAGYRPRISEGCYSNTKITTHTDLIERSDLKTGVGYDVHELVSDRDLILGGVYVPYEKGLLGHSDADVLTHAVMDALLSAGGLPDIGRIFPDTDPAYKGCSSILMLEHVGKLLKRRKMLPRYISAVIIAEKPKLAKFIPRMRECIARALGISPSMVNISATTTEGLGVVGEGRAIASQAFALVGA